MSTYVISDIHGCYNQFIQMLDLIKFNDNDELYILGDVIDRGPNSAAMLKWILNSNDNVHFMLGNHESMMLEVASESGTDLSPRFSYDWFRTNDGFNTREQLLEELTEEELYGIIELLRKAPTIKELTVNDNIFVLVHAGLRVRPFMKSEDILRFQSRQDSLWIRQDWLINNTPLPYTVVFGHTSTKHIWWYIDSLEPEKMERMEGSPGIIAKWDNKIAIDCGCSIGGSLGCIRLDDLKEFYVPGINVLKK